MFKVSVTSNLNQAAIEEELTGTGGSVGRFGQQIATAITQRARAGAPVDTGALQGSIRTATDRAGADLAWTISSDVTYAEYQELGFYHNWGGYWVPGKHFIENAANEVLAGYM